MANPRRAGVRHPTAVQPATVADATLIRRWPVGRREPWKHGHGVVAGAVAADCPSADVDAGGLDCAVPAGDRVLDGGAEVPEPTVGVGLGVRVWVTVAVWVLVPERDTDGLTVTVVASVVVPVSGEVFPPCVGSGAGAVAWFWR